MERRRWNCQVKSLPTDAEMPLAGIEKCFEAIHQAGTIE